MPASLPESNTGLASPWLLIKFYFKSKDVRPSWSGCCLPPDFRILDRALVRLTPALLLLTQAALLLTQALLLLTQAALLLTQAALLLTQALLLLTQALLRLTQALLRLTRAGRRGRCGRKSRDVATTPWRTHRNCQTQAREWAKNLKTLSQMAGKT